jgi:uncharacterized protein (TIGR03435 family)
MRHTALAVVLSQFLVAAALAFPLTSNLQPPTAVSGPSFEVATIKPNKSDSNRSSLDLQPGGRFTAINVSLAALISVAYGEPYAPLQRNRLVINPRWMIGDSGYASFARFDIVAKADASLTREHLPVALQKLLVDRFQLVVHHDNRELPIYQLVLARTDGQLGPKLRPSGVDCSDPNAPAAKNDDGTSKCGFRRLPGRATGRATMADLAMRLLNNAVDDHRPVEDRSGLSGTFEFDLEWTPVAPVPADAPPAPPVDPNGISLFTALREQLGLRLEPAKQRIDILVVDRAERPTED